MNTKEDFVRAACVAKAAVDSGIDLNAYAFGVEYGYASQAAEIKRLRDALEEIKADALAKLAQHQGLNANETLHTIKNALKPQESEVSNG